MDLIPWDDQRPCNVSGVGWGRVIFFWQFWDEFSIPVVPEVIEMVASDEWCGQWYESEWGWFEDCCDGDDCQL